MDVVDVVEGFVKTKPEAIGATHENVNLRRVVRVWNISNGQMGRDTYFLELVVLRVINVHLNQQMKGMG